VALILLNDPCFGGVSLISEGIRKQLDIDKVLNSKKMKAMNETRCKCFLTNM